MPGPCEPDSLLRYFNSSPDVIRLVVLMYVRFSLSPRNVEGLLLERVIDICHKTVRRRFPSNYFNHGSREGGYFDRGALSLANPYFEFDMSMIKIEVSVTPLFYL